MSNWLLVINGRPLSGKDTLTNYLKNYYGEDGFEFMSSIDPIKEMLFEAGIDTSKKTPADRKLLATIKAAVEEHSNFITDYLMESVYENSKKSWKDGHSLFVTHIREASNITKLKEAVAQEMGAFEFVTIWIFREEIENNLQSNSSDKISYSGYPYDILINNNYPQVLASMANLIVAEIKAGKNKTELINEINAFQPLT